MKYWIPYIIGTVLVIVICASLTAAIVNSNMPLWLKIMLLK